MGRTVLSDDLKSKTALRLIIDPDGCRFVMNQILMNQMIMNQA